MITLVLGFLPSLCSLWGPVSCHPHLPKDALGFSPGRLRRAATFSHRICSISVSFSRFSNLFPGTVPFMGLSRRCFIGLQASPPRRPPSPNSGLYTVSGPLQRLPRRKAANLLLCVANSVFTGGKVCYTEHDHASFYSTPHRIRRSGNKTCRPAALQMQT